MGKLHRIFYDDVKDKTIKSKSLLELGEFLEISKLFHTIKGGAGFVKEHKIRALAEDGISQAKNEDKTGLLETCNSILKVLGSKEAGDADH